LRLQIELSEHPADLANLVSLGLAIFFRLEIQENEYAGTREDVMTAFEAHCPTRGLKVAYDVFEPMTVVLAGFKERRLGFLKVGHGLHLRPLVYSVNYYE
jgi:hypothetical protein